MKKKISILLVAVMTLAMLTACGSGENSKPNTGMNAGNGDSIVSGTESGSNVENEGGETGSTITDYSGFEGKYWYLMDYVDDGMGLCKYGFYLDGNGTMTQVTCYEDGRYEESTCKYDSLTAEKTEEGIAYTFNRYYGGDSEPVEGYWVVNTEGRISQQFWAEDGEFYCDYSPVDAGEFYAKNESLGGINVGASDNAPGGDGNTTVGGGSCQHTTTENSNKGNAPVDQHTVTCWDCGAFVGYENCNFGSNGRCMNCNTACTHSNGYTANGECDQNSHYLACNNECGHTKREQHTLVYDEIYDEYSCSVCGVVVE